MKIPDAYLAVGYAFLQPDAFYGRQFFAELLQYEFTVEEYFKSFTSFGRRKRKKGDEQDEKQG